ncbi:alpha/beta hydrolase [Streptomyces sp. NPDC088090]|uniref:alpha/beta hydrolase n=1 Tax=Streptomyces sp. NPDC088090 TaxID=3365822 RepID=UPI00385015AD
MAAVVAATAVAALLPTLTPALAAAPPAAPAHTAPAPSAPASAALAEYTRQQPRWAPCDPQGPAEFECATIEVPLDYGRPSGRKLDLAISRIRATSPRDRHGVLLINPGGPGGQGLDMPLYLRSELPDEVSRRFDLVGFDPRGVGRSSPVGCGLTGDELNWQRPYKAAAFAEDVRWARTVAEKCRAANGAVLPHLTTRNTARDMDLVRAVLGERRISYLGYSYGTYLGAVYTQLFPRRADRFVLDSAVDPARIWRGMIQVWAEGAEPAFDRWADWTADRHAVYGLGDTPEEVRATFWGLVARADRTPIEIDGLRLTGDDIRVAARPAFFAPESAAESVVRLKEAAEGGAPATAPSLRPAPPRPVPPSFARPSAGFLAGPALPGTSEVPAAREVPAVPADNMDAAFWSVVCADTRAWPRDPERYRRDAVRDRAAYPLYGDVASHVKPCAFWQRGSEPATRIGNAVGALILQNEWDSQTPLVSGQGLRRVMKGARMVTVLGGQGHGVYGSRSCADATATAYLTTGRLPAGDTTCRATPEQAANGLRQPLPLPVPQGLPAGRQGS